ncbi:MAG: DNA polymerase III subunit beta [Endomicrobium sp.]|jgi:DNA polymerase-3 subunit beta|nr:DNA polymerase III subunit beta [Endomicrobium sp.]
MNIICGKDELLRGIQTIHSTTSSRGTLPVLSNFLFETKGNRIKLSSTDLEIAIECYIKAEIIEDGGITIPTKKFSDIVRELLINKEIEIKTDEMNHINITSGKSKFNLMGISKSEYPIIPTLSREKCFTIEKEIFVKMLKKTVFSVSRDLQRYVLNGIYFALVDNRLSMTATDGRRLAHIETSSIKETIKEGKAIVPTKAVNDILRLLSSDIESENINISITNNQIAVGIDDIVFLSTLIDGVFPSYEQVIPKNSQLKIKLNVRDTLAAVKQMAALTDNKLSSNISSAVKFYFDTDILKISASTAGIGSGEVELEVEYKDKPSEINFNPNFVKEVLQNIDENFAIFEFTDSLNPALICPENSKDYLYVIMPMRV